MTPPSPSKTLSKLRQLQKKQDPDSQLAILRISEPFTSSNKVVGLNRSPSKRTSDASENAFEDVTPASLEAELTHYKVCAYLVPGLDGYLS